MTLSQADYTNLLEFRTRLRAFQRWSEEQAAQAGLTPAQHQLLLAVKGHPDPAGPTITDLTGYLLLRHHSVVGLINRATTAQLVIRTTDATDARIARIALTPHAEDRLATLTRLHMTELATIAPILDHLVTGTHLDPASPADEALGSSDRAR